MHVDHLDLKDRRQDRLQDLHHWDHLMDIHLDHLLLVLQEGHLIEVQHLVQGALDLECQGVPALVNRWDRDQAYLVDRLAHNLGQDR